MIVTDSTAAFDHHPRTRLVFGVGAVSRVGELAAELGARCVLVVTDAGIVRAGHCACVEESLRHAGLSVVRFDGVRENPTTRDVDDCLVVARGQGVNFIVGLGGGSSMDTAKGTNFLLTNGGQMQDYWGVGKAAQPMLPLIAIPTTAGTGSECQSAALIADETTHQKMACLDSKALARVAILDPALTLSQPSAVTAHTGVDAIAHAVETMVTRKRNPLSQMYSREAFRLCSNAFPEVLAFPDNIEARGRMLLGAALAGLAIENSMLGAAHSAANPLTAHFGLVHGEAVGLMLPAVIQFNATDPVLRAQYEELAVAAGWSAPGDDPDSSVRLLVQRLKELMAQAGLALSLADLGINHENIPMLAEEATKQWTAQFNPRAMEVTDFASLFQQALQASR